MGNVNKTTLFYKDASESIRFWSIEGKEFELIMEFGTVGGETQIQTEMIHYGVGGRTRLEQLLSRYNSRINKKKDKGYTADINVAKHSTTVNSLGLLKPMLAHPIDKIKNCNFEGALVQHKYDGHRCIVTKHNGKKIAYSRNGKLITTIDHILDGIEINESQYIDGELYIHGKTLQSISSLIKKDQDESSNLKYYVYDTIENINYIERYAIISNMELGRNAIIAPTWLYNEDHISDQLNASIDSGYEGLIVRFNGFPYEDNKRSKGLAKIKRFIDDEFIVIDITMSSRGIPVLKCLMETGKLFSATAPGTMEDKNEIFDNKENYIGRMINVKYANLTKDGIPFHPIAVSWREKGDE